MVPLRPYHLDAPCTAAVCHVRFLCAQPSNAFISPSHNCKQTLSRVCWIGSTPGYSLPIFLCCYSPIPRLYPKCGWSYLRSYCFAQYLAFVGNDLDTPPKFWVLRGRLKTKNKFRKYPPQRTPCTLLHPSRLACNLVSSVSPLTHSACAMRTVVQLASLSFFFFVAMFICVSNDYRTQVRLGLSLDIFPLAGACMDGARMGRWGQVCICK